MSILLRSNVISVLRHASKRGLSPSLMNLMRRTVAIEHKTSDANIENIQPKAHVMYQYMNMLQGDLHDKLLGSTDVMKMKTIILKSEPWTSAKSLLFLKCCGGIAIDVKPEIRMKYLYNIWNLIQKSGLSLDISHYNTFLKAHVENESSIDHEGFLKTMRENGITPNRVTYQHLLTYFCYSGQLVKATEILEKIKEKDITLNENIFNSLILGHAVVNDIDGAEEILDIMTEKKLAIDSTTYFMYICGLARSGNLYKITEILEQCSSNNIKFSTKKLLDIVYYLIVNGHTEYAMDMLKEMNIPVDSKEGIILQFRLLHMRKFEVLLDVLNINSGDPVPKLNLIMRYLERNENLSTIMEFKDICVQKGIDPAIASSLLQNLRFSPDSGMSVENIYDYFKAEGKVDFFNFLPFLHKYAEKGKLTELMATIKTILDCNLRINFSCFRTSVIERLNLEQYDLSYLAGLFHTAGLSYNFVVKAYLITALKSGNLELLQRLLSSFHLPQNYLDVQFDLVDGVNKSYGNIVAYYLKIALCQAVYNQNLKDNVEFREDGKEAHFKLNWEYVRSYDTIITSIFQSCGTESLIQFLEEMIKLQVPISPEATDFIKSLVEDEQILKRVEKLNGSTIKLTNLKQYKFLTMRSSSDVDEPLKRLRFLIDSGDLSAAEQNFKETQSLQSYQSFETLIRALGKAGEEEKVIHYIQEWCSSDYSNSYQRRGGFYIETEALKRKLVNEAKNSILKRRLITQRGFLKEIAAILKEYNDDLLSLFFNHTRTGVMDKILVPMYIEFDTDFFLRLFKLMYPKGPISFGGLSYYLYPCMYSNGRVDLIEQIHEMLTNEKSVSYEICYSLLTGKISKFCNILDSSASQKVNLVRVVEGVEDDKKRGELVRNILSVGKGLHFGFKNILYEILIEEYKEKNEPINKCVELWYDQQEENIQPTNLFFIYLADIYKKNNVPPDFQIPKLLPGSFPEIDQYPPQFSRYLKRCIHGLQNLDSKEEQIGRIKLLIRTSLLTHEDMSALVKQINNNSDGLVKLMEKGFYFWKWRKAFLENDIPSLLKQLGIDTPLHFYKKTPFSFLSQFFTRLSPPTEDLGFYLMWFYWSEINPNPKLVELCEACLAEERIGKTFRSVSVDRTVPLNISNRFFNFFREKVDFNQMGKSKDFNEGPQDIDDLSSNSTETDVEYIEDKEDMLGQSYDKSNVKGAGKSETRKLDTSA